MKVELMIGLFSIALYLVLMRFTKVSALVLGLLIGVGLCFLIIGMLPVAAYDKIKEFKGFFVKRII
jgi:uncharacterized membrane protein YedE/YeeE